MADPNTSTPPPATARASFLLLARLVSKMQPPARAAAVEGTLREFAEVAGDLPLTPLELADAYAALAAVCGIEDKATTARRQTCAELAGLLGQNLSKVAGQRPPVVNAMKVWSWIGEAFSAPADAATDALARARTMRATASREAIEIVGRAALAVIGRGPAQIVTPGGRSRFLSTAPSDKGQLTITGLVVGEGKAEREYVLPMPLVVSQQAAIHKVGHPWARMGFEFGDTGHDHPPAKETP